MTPRPAKRDERAGPTIERLAQALAVERGIPIEYAYGIVRALLGLMRDDLATAERFVIPGALIIEKAPEGSRKAHKVSFTLRRRQRAKAKMAAKRAKRGD